MSTGVSKERGPERDLAPVADLDLRVVGRAGRRIESVFDQLALRLPREGRYVAQIRGDTLTLSEVTAGIQRYALAGTATVDSVEVSPEGIRLRLRGCAVGKLELTTAPVTMPASAKHIDQVEGPAPFIMDYAKLVESGDNSPEVRARKRELLRRIAEEMRAAQSHEASHSTPIQPSVPPSSGESRWGSSRGAG